MSMMLHYYLKTFIIFIDYYMCLLYVFNCSLKIFRNVALLALQLPFFDKTKKGAADEATAMYFKPMFQNIMRIG